MTPTAHAHNIALNSMLLNTTLAVALRNLDEALAGWPTQTPGAAPAEARGISECPVKECNKNRPCPEHDGGTRTDRAAQTLDELRQTLHEANKHLTRAANLSYRWATPRIDDTTVSNRLAIIEGDIWCRNCKLHGFNNVRTNGDHCEFCSQVKSDHKKYPNEWLLDAHARRRLNSADFKRFNDSFRKPKKTNAA